MRSPVAFTAICAAIALAPSVAAADRFYGDPPDDHHPWCIHDMRRPLVPVVTPGTASTPEQPGKPPSDAVVLFDGTAESLKANWEADKPGNQESQWEVKDGAMECRPKSGYIRTKQKFGDVQLHVEWAAPKEVNPDHHGQSRGNSGIFLMGDFETQVLDNFNNPTYPDGTACAIYGINPPMANALRPPGVFQVVDIVFRRPLSKDGQLVDPGHETVFINGVLMQDAIPFEGPGGHMGRSKPRQNNPETGHLRFQDHGNPVRFRNVWLRPLPPRTSEGGCEGVMTTEACMAKRKETAAKCRDDAAKEADALGKMKFVLESLVYEKEPAALEQATTMTTAYVAGLKALAADKLDGKKEEAKEMNRILQYLARKVQVELPAKAEMEKIIEAKGWKK